jgi:hypothetical protein
VFVGDVIRTDGATNGLFTVASISNATTMTVAITHHAVGAITGIFLDATEPNYAATTADPNFKATGSQTVTLTSPTGNLHVGDQVKVTMTNTPAVSATASVTIGGTVIAGNIVTVTVGGTPFSSTALSTSTTATIASALATLMNASASYGATATGSVITITVTTPGVAGNATTLAATVAEGGVTALTIHTLGGLTSPAYVENSKTIQLVAVDQTGAVVTPVWTFSGSSVTGVAGGLVTAHATTTEPSVITATLGSLSAQFVVNVIPARTITSLVVTPATANLAVPSSGTQQFGAIAVSAAYSALDYTTQVTWSDDLPVANVSNAAPTQGLLTYSSAESGHVYALFVTSGFSAMATVTIIGTTGVSLTTGAATSVTSTGATLHGTTGTSAPTESFFQYGTTSVGPWTKVTASPAVITANTAFTATLTGLTTGQLYYVRAANTVAGVDTFGSVLTFTAGTVSLTTGAVTSVTSTGATLNGTTGTSAPTESFFQYGTTSVGPWTKVTASPAVAIANTAFTATLTGLTAGQLYYVRAANTVAGVDNFGSVLTFTTGTVSPVSPTTGAVTSVTSTGATLHGTTGTPAPTASFFQYGTTSVGPWTKVTASPTVITANTAFTATLTGLTAGQLYYVRAANTVADVDTFGSVLTFTTTPAAVAVKIVIVLTVGTNVVTVDGKATSVDAAPEIVNSLTFVPIRFIAETFGATVEWFPESRGITITLGTTTIGLQIGKATVVINGNTIALEAAPYIKNSRTMVPLRVISESFGADVVWNSTAHTITISYMLP